MRKRATFRSRVRPAAPRRPRKRFGQHFLAPAWADRVVSAIAPASGDVFLEIGPGTGALTVPLAASGAPILGIEVDRDLAADLARRAPANVTVLAGDVLETDVIPFLSGLGTQRTFEPGAPPPSPRRVRVVGNLPYNIASPILFRLRDLQERHRFFHDAVLMVQREVADRLTAKPATRDYGVLTILTARHARVTRLFDLPPGAFRPAPKVRSSVVRLAFAPPEHRVPDEALLERMVKSVFGGRRKTLANALKRFSAAAPAILALAEIDGRRRPETLQPAEVARLAELFAVLERSPVV